MEGMRRRLWAKSNSESGALLGERPCWLERAVIPQRHDIELRRIDGVEGMIQQWWETRRDNLIYALV